MEKEQRNRLQKATQDARKLLEEEFRSQLLQTYDIDVEKVRWSEEPGAHLQAEQRLIRDKLVAWIEHKEAQIHDRKEALLLALREMAFTALNRFVALKLMEARELVRPCVSGGLESEGFLEFTAVAQGLLADQESSYRLYLETIFEDVSRELRALFDPRDPASLLWPKRTALLELLDILNKAELAELWIEDETLGWVYQYFNGDAERKKMREESAAPRNSRELAVRNQFFTPRYVVEFLTDNTLGRIWYEMRQGNTGLKDQCRYLVRRPNEVWLQPGEEPPAQADADEALSQEELLRQPVYIPQRPLKDPREIRMLDPACGSMHFGLYAFDLYLEIYSEAWEIAKASEEQAQQGDAFVPFVAYAAGFADKADFLREAPKLILQHNIHGIDIDPRATQIARLTLWLRAQRAWLEEQVQIIDRPKITRSNIVCAEPMPGEKELLADFVHQQFPEPERRIMQRLMETVFGKMEIAGEAGSLLKIEEEIRDAIEESRREWLRLAIQQRNLFDTFGIDEIEKSDAHQLRGDLGIDQDFWLDIEERIYASLSNYAHKAEIEGGLRQRLFAEDAAQGFAFIDICRKKHDVALMNPPFGEPSLQSIEYLKNSFCDSRFDIYAAFVERGLGLLHEATPGRLGIISSRAGFFLSSLTNWRRWLLRQNAIETWVDQGYGVLDSGLDSAASYTIKKGKPLTLSWIVSWLDASPEVRDEQVGDLKRLSANNSRLLLKSLKRFLETPGSTFCYWLQESAIDLLIKGERFKGSGRDVRQGMASGDNFRFVRTFWEIPEDSVGREHRWVPYAKGGDFSPFYRDIELCIDWKDNGAQIKTMAADQYGSESRTIKSQDKYFQHGLTFTIYTKKGFNVRPLPAGCIFDVAGSSVFAEGASEDDLFYILGFLSSPVFQYFISALSDDRKWQVGLLQNVPWIDPCPTSKKEISANTKAAFVFAQQIASFDETDHCHLMPTLIKSSIADLAKSISDRMRLNGAEINRLRDRNTELICLSYGLDLNKLDRKPDFTTSSSLERYHLEIGGNSVSSYQAAMWVISHLLGCVYGRWDIRYATGERSEILKSTNAFGSLPACLPGQLKGKGGMPAKSSDVPLYYPINVAWDGILVEDSDHPLDIARSIQEAIKVVWGSEAPASGDHICQEVCASLGVSSLRDVFADSSSFFADHLSRYSKSRRQAPIYWQFSAGSGSFSVWLYYHRFTQDTLYRILRDFVEPRIQQAERDQFELESQAALSGDAATRLQKMQNLLQDLRILKGELDLVAPLWNPNLNDGVIINHAILWRITPYTPWQKKCKECWDKLVKGDYDWAHLSLHLWPERVIPKCTTDRSLAIAHGLEERLWQETNNGNWLPRQLSEADLQALIAEHSNPAVKSALERFLAAPPPVAQTRTRAPRATRSTASGTTRKPRGSTAVVDAEATRQTLLALTAAPAEGLSRNAIAELLGVEAASLTAVIKQLKATDQIEQLGAARGARYVLSEQGRAAVASQAGEDD